MVLSVQLHWLVLNFVHEPTLRFTVNWKGLTGGSVKDRAALSMISGASVFGQLVGKTRGQPAAIPALHWL